MEMTAEQLPIVAKRKPTRLASFQRGREGLGISHDGADPKVQACFLMITVAYLSVERPIKAIVKRIVLGLGSAAKWTSNTWFW